MSKEFSGEQKLRIVLESIIRNVPKGEQSQKYGVTEEEFQSWHDHLIQNGGKIFDSSVRTSLDTRKPKRKMSPLVRIFLSISLLTNLGLIIFGIVYVINRENKKDEWVQDDTNSIDSPINLTDNYEVQNMSKTDIEPTEEKEIPIDVILENSREKPFPSSNNDDIGNLLASPNSLPVPSLLPPVSIAEPANEVSFMGKSYEGRHVVYLLDVGTYVLDGNDSVGQFEKNKESLINSIITLSPNSYFNLVLYWNLREVAALGKTLLKASQENKKYAIDWIASLGKTKESIKIERNQYYPKESLSFPPMAGIIGPWYALSTAISYDPDLVFVLAGNIPSYDRSEVPRSHYEGLGKINFQKLQGGRVDHTKVDALTRETARKWFYAITPISSLPSSEAEVEEIALLRLGLSAGDSRKAVYQPLAWNKAFENFLSSLEMGFDQIPQTHFMVNLPKYVSWPSPLLDSVKEFAESSRGSFSQNLNLP
tara:strand:- start:1366 stop:2805 length:1440 start_codon:yes stop_codon:yes gene_type:complete